VEELFQLIIKSYGLLGLVMLSPFVALKFMWSHAKDLQKDLKAANERINETHSRRVEDSKEIADKLMEMIKEHAELSKETNIALERVGDMLSVLQNTGVSHMRHNGGR
jgi:predicted sugar kinase